MATNDPDYEYANHQFYSSGFVETSVPRFDLHESSGSSDHDENGAQDVDELHVFEQDGRRLEEEIRIEREQEITGTVGKIETRFKPHAPNRWSLYITVNGKERHIKGSWYFLSV